MKTAEKIMTGCLRNRSTIVPNTMPNTASSSMYAPPMMPVASTDFVSRYTQKVSANQRKLVVMFATAVLTRTWVKVRIPSAGTGRAAPSAGADGVVMKRRVRPGADTDNGHREHGGDLG